MLWAISQWWRARTAPVGRPFGYRSESVGTAVRARRCAAHWADHLARCQAVVKAWATGGERITVLGAGLVHDLPVEWLAGRYDRIDLVDMVFLPPAMEAARRHRNIQLVQGDVTGVLPAIAAARNPVDVDSALQCDEPYTGRGDVVSMNVLSQLSVLPLRFLDRRLPGLDPARRDRWDRVFAARHWARLQREDRALLIADSVLEELDAGGAVIARWDEGVEAGFVSHAFERWTWDVAPDGELGGGLSARHEVVAVRCGRS